MRGLAFVVATMGCGFQGPHIGGALERDGGGIDGSVDLDGSVGLDAAVVDGAIAFDAHTPAVVDTLAIPGTGEIIASNIVPTLGVTYQLRASGFVQVATGLDSDAEYWGFPGAMNDFTTDNTVDMGLGIDDTTIDTLKTRWGPYTPTHVYTIAHVGTGAKLHAQYEDNFDGNNTGTMTLEILQ